MTSASGGLAVPSTLSVRAFAIRAAIASSPGMFLYPLIIGAVFWSLASFSLSSFSVSLFSSSRFSAVSCSPPSPIGVAVLLWGGETFSWVGEVDLVLGALTAVESALDTTLDATDADEPVRRRDAARRGRDADDAEEVGLRLMRAASWLRDGMRAPGAGRSDLEGPLGASVAVSAAAIVNNVELVEEHDVGTRNEALE
jgi:hypothetical protein